jgi:hypothetical protein
MAAELAMEIKQKGFRVYLAESGTHGYFVNAEETRVVSFQVDLVTSFSGNYISDHSGTGWQMDGNLSYQQMLDARPPHWIGESNLKLITPEQHRERYQKSSKYKEVEGEASCGA